MKTIFNVILFALIANNQLNAQAGALDLSFDTDGKVTTTINQYNEGNSMAIQTDGKIIVAGTSYNGFIQEFAVVRYNPDGSLDNSFDGDGKVTTAFGVDNASGKSVTIQQDGKIIVAGCVALMDSSHKFALARYNSDGSLDNTFDGDGKLTTDFGMFISIAWSVSIQQDGKIIAGGGDGNNFFLIARYNLDGSLDNSFNGNGKVITGMGGMSSGRAIAIQADGKIILAGYSWAQFCAARYNIDGLPDNSFDIDGIIRTPIGIEFDGAYSIDIQPDGKLVLAGFSSTGNPPAYNNGFTLVRYNTDGSLDNSFSGDGKLTTTNIGPLGGYAFSVAIQPDGKIIAVGSSDDGVGTHFALTRYNNDGTLDNSFDGDGMLTTTFVASYDVAYAVAIQSDLKIVAAGTTYNGITYEFALARYISGLNVGVVNFLSENNSVLIYPNPITQQATLEYTLGNQEEITIEIINQQGQLIKNIVDQQYQELGKHQQSIILSEDMPNGYYYIVISAPSGKVSVKIMKK